MTIIKVKPEEQRIRGAIYKCLERKKEVIYAEMCNIKHNRNVNNQNIGEIMQYERVVYWSKEDNCWVVVVPELTGCQADGETLQEAIANSEIIIQEWIDTAVSLGRKIPEPVGTGKVAFLLSLVAQGDI